MAESAAPAKVATSQVPAGSSAPGKAEAAPDADEGQDESVDAPAVHYACENGTTAIANYVESGALEQRVNLEVDGKEYGLGLTKAASGARFETDTALPSGKTLVWWSKGNSAMLIEHDPADVQGDSDQIVNCTEVAKR